MAGRPRPPHLGTIPFAVVGELGLPSITTVVANLRSLVAIGARSFADRLVGPVERWCPICELELQLHAADASCLAPNSDDD